jgi:hypothetical protein
MLLHNSYFFERSDNFMTCASSLLLLTAAGPINLSPERDRYSLSEYGKF